MAVLSSKAQILYCTDRVVDEWAMMFPPMGFFGSGLNMADPST